MKLKRVLPSVRVLDPFGKMGLCFAHIVPKSKKKRRDENYGDMPHIEIRILELGELKKSIRVTYPEVVTAAITHISESLRVRYSRDEKLTLPVDVSDEVKLRAEVECVEPVEWIEQRLAERKEPGKEAKNG
ncbi:MAG: hypothetical protein AAF514_05760 [Verrucomicrobiota bacterium]